MPVSDQHPLYLKFKNQRQLVRDCVAGSEAIKNSRRTDQTGAETRGSTGLHNALGSRYLPPPNPSDNSIENRDRFEAYKHRANFVNFTGHTKDGFLGMIGRKKSVFEIDSVIDYLKENADGAGLGLQQIAQNNISELLEVGLNGLLADFPESDGGTQAQTGDLKGVIKQYPAESIINWRTDLINGQTTLVKVVLAEEVERVDHDGFGLNTVTFHRVLLLIDGVYKQNIFNEEDKLMFFVGEDGELTSDIIPKKFDGSTWNVIPFEFSGAINNDTNPDKAPLYDLAEINISHYRNSADFEESSFMVGQPTPILSGLTQSWVNDVLEGGVQFGSRTAVLLGPNARAELLQASPNQMPERGMELKETQMVKIGAKIIAESGGVETAEAARIRFAGQSSKLALVVSNTEKSLLRVMSWIAEFMNSTGENIVTINKEFYESTVNPQLLIANMQLLDRGVIAKSDLRDQMRKSNLIDADRSDDDIDEEVGNIDPLA